MIVDRRLRKQDLCEISAAIPPCDALRGGLKNQLTQNQVLESLSLNPLRGAVKTDWISRACLSYVFAFYLMLLDGIKSTQGNY